jgi:hypothetical protein
MLLWGRGIFQGLGSSEEVRDVGGTLEVEEVLGTLEGLENSGGGNTLSRERNIPGGWRKFGRKWIGPEGSRGIAEGFGRSEMLFRGWRQRILGRRGYSSFRLIAVRSK